MKKLKAFPRSLLLMSTAMILLLSLVLSGCNTGSTAPITASTTSSVTLPTTQTTIPPTSAVTTPPVTTAPATIPPATTAPVTVPPTTATVPQTTVPATTQRGEYIGSLYTRQFLETLDRTMHGCASWGAVNDKNRPTQAIALTERFQKYDARFIGEDNNSIYLSYNCGYEYQNLTTVILDTLKEKGAKATFFVNLHFARTNPQVIQRIISEGHTLGNHCANHPELPTLSIDGIVEEIMTLHNYIQETFHYEMKVFRPPSGYYSEQVLAIAQSLGYRTYNFSFTYVDWETANQPDPTATLQNQISKAHSGAIYQLHSVSSTNATILGPLIDNLRAKGYSFAALR